MQVGYTSFQNTFWSCTTYVRILPRSWERRRIDKCVPGERRYDAVNFVSWARIDSLACILINILILGFHSIHIETLVFHKHVPSKISRLLKFVSVIECDLTSHTTWISSGRIPARMSWCRNKRKRSHIVEQSVTKRRRSMRCHSTYQKLIQYDHFDHRQYDRRMRKR